MTRRDYGTVRRLPSGRWQARYATPSGDRQTAPTTFSTRAAAAAFLASVQTDQDRGGWLDPAASTLTFGEYATTWLAGRADLPARTAELYQGLLNRHLEPQLGTVALTRISTTLARQWYAARAKDGIGRSTVAKAYRLLKCILNTAVVHELLTRKACVIRGASAEQTPERVPPTLAEAHALADAIEPRWRMFVLLATWSGLRWGELVGLRRASIDIERGRVTVTHQLVETAQGRELGPPKTDAGRRTVHLPPHLMPDLRDHLDRWVGSEPDAWLFCGPLGAPLARRNFTVHWTRTRAEAGLPQVRFHDLRHLSAGSVQSDPDWLGAVGLSPPSAHRCVEPLEPLIRLDVRLAPPRTMVRRIRCHSVSGVGKTWRSPWERSRSSRGWASNRRTSSN